MTPPHTHALCCAIPLTSPQEEKRHAQWLKGVLQKQERERRASAASYSAAGAGNGSKASRRRSKATAPSAAMVPAEHSAASSPREGGDGVASAPAAAKIKKLVVPVLLSKQAQYQEVRGLCLWLWMEVGVFLLVVCSAPFTCALQEGMCQRPKMAIACVGGLTLFRTAARVFGRFTFHSWGLPESHTQSALEMESILVSVLGIGASSASAASASPGMIPPPPSRRAGGEGSSSSSTKAHFSNVLAADGIGALTTLPPSSGCVLVETALNKVNLPVVSAHGTTITTPAQWRESIREALLLHDILFTVPIGAVALLRGVHSALYLLQETTKAADDDGGDGDDGGDDGGEEANSLDEFHLALFAIAWAVPVMACAYHHHRVRSTWWPAFKRRLRHLSTDIRLAPVVLAFMLRSCILYGCKASWRGIVRCATQGIFIIITISLLLVLIFYIAIVIVIDSISN
jgi:hypothetical protein